MLCRPSLASRALLLSAVCALGCSTGPSMQRADETGTTVQPNGSNVEREPAPAPEPPKPPVTERNDPEVDEVHFDEGQALDLKLSEPNERCAVSEGLPPGAHFNALEGKLHFTPDFTQSGHYHLVLSCLADGGVVVADRELSLHVRNVIDVPAPEVVSRENRQHAEILVLKQLTDSFLEAPENAGHSYNARVAIPRQANAQRKAPVYVQLHGLAGTPSAQDSDEFVISPHDPRNTYWYGYRGPSDEIAKDYTARRVLALLEWVLRTYPGADANRVYLTGNSMGGGGGFTIGLEYARHFAGVVSTLGQPVPRNHRNARVNQLRPLWGPPSAGGPWDDLDATVRVRDSLAARNQFVFTKHGKDDGVIQFGALVHKSPLTGISYGDVVEVEAIGHTTVWDEGGHGTPDPRLGSDWWMNERSQHTRLRRDRAFPAFSRSSRNGDPGDGSGNGRQNYREDQGYAGATKIPLDTGWAGEVSGMRNGGLRWDGEAIVDTVERLSLSLWVDPTATRAEKLAPNKFSREVLSKVTVDVTPRRAQSFQLLPGERVQYTFGKQRGEVVAKADGAVTVPRLVLTEKPQALELKRLPEAG